MFRKVNTEQYPEQAAKYPPKPRFHGRHQLNRYADGLEKCIGCELCAWACPADAIYVEGAPNTEEERYSPGERYGRVYQINYLRCIFCGLCIEACPADAIYVEGAPNTEEERYSPGERYGRVYQINYLRCIFCGLCIEACPTRALTMTTEFELADDSRTNLIYEKKDLLAPLTGEMVPPPHPMVMGLTDADYYAGLVTGPDER